MKTTLAALALGAFLILLPSQRGHAQAAPDPWVGHWTLIHIDPTLPLGTMKITHHGHETYKLRVSDVQDDIFCPGQPVAATGEGSLTEALHMTAQFHYQCLDSGEEGDTTLLFVINLDNPNGIYEIANIPGTGRVWTRPKRGS
jgi:hypothetical protein